MMIEQRIWLCVLGLLLAVTPWARGDFQDGTPLGRALMPLDQPEIAKYFGPGHEGLLSLAPVVLPEGDNVLGNNQHFGWPIATLANDGSLIVVYYRISSHWQRGKNDEFMSNAVMVRSTDGGVSWSAPVDMRSFAAGDNKYKTGFGNTITTAADGTVCLLTGYGVFRSQDNGQTWQHMGKAFSDEQLQGPRVNSGPKLIEHPQFGLMAFGHDVQTGGLQNTIWIRYSQDQGQTWQETSQSFDIDAKPVEPTAIRYQDALIILARSHGSFDQATRTWRYVQLVSRDGVEPMKAQYTNIPTSDVMHLWPDGEPPYGALKGLGPWSQDTTSLIFNPFTRRIEAVVTNRTGGGPDHLNDHEHMTLNLWSIDPQALLAGSNEWRFEGTLLRRIGATCSKSPLDAQASYYDGMHPGGSVVDAERGVQHIFIYSGYTKGGCGIYHIARTLDTPKLVRWLSEH